MTPTGAPLLALRGITKRYGELLANDAVSLEVAAGEVLGILGENGAGKSTLMNVLGGLTQADSGEIRLAGQPVIIDSPRAAAALGIGMVHQHYMLVPALTVAENFALGDTRWGAFPVDYHALEQRIGTLAQSLGMPIEFSARVRDLPIGAQQRVEILKALAREPRVLILDEPTAVLPPAERSALFNMVRTLRQRGVAIILISHKLEDMLEACDRVVVMRQGRVAATRPIAGASRGDLVRLVVGEEQLPANPRPVPALARVALKVEGLRARRSDGTLAFSEVSFALHAGEVLGVAGVDGNGQSELVHILTGMAKPDAGRLVYRIADREHAGPLSAGTLRRLGLAHIAEDRLRHGAIGPLDLAANWLLTHLHLPRFNRLGWVAPGTASAHVRTAIVDYSIQTHGPSARLEELSGGNQQKLVIARELANRPAIVIAAYPTRGLDVRTMAFVKAQLLAARNRGAAVLVVSNDLAEITEIADSVMVMAGGHAHGPVPAATTTLQGLGAWMTGRTVQ